MRQFCGHEHLAQGVTFEKVGELCPECGHDGLWRVTGSTGATLKCPVCEYVRRIRDGEQTV